MKLHSVESKSEQFAALQRFYFRTLEKYLDSGAGECPLRHAPAAEVVIAELSALREWQVEIPHYSIMPNHWHAMVAPRETCMRSLAEIMRRLKGRSARAINMMLGRSGALWQREWFDRWMRDDDEYRCARYIRENPFKAGVPQQNRWTQ